MLLFASDCIAYFLDQFLGRTGSTRCGIDYLARSVRGIIQGMIFRSGSVEECGSRSEPVGSVVNLRLLLAGTKSPLRHVASGKVTDTHSIQKFERL